MPEARRFIPGQIYEEVFDTPSGWIVFSADIEVAGQTLCFVEVDLRPLENVRLDVGTAGILAVKQCLFQRARAEGYTDFELTARRISGANPGRSLILRGSLEGGSSR